MSKKADEDFTKGSFISDKESEVSASLPPKLPKKSFKKQLLLILFALIFLSVTAVGLLFFWNAQYEFSASPPLPMQVSLEPLIRFELDENKFFTEWKEHVFHGRTTYQIEPTEDGSKMLHASSQDSSSFIYQEVDVKLSNRPFLSWKWKAIQFPTGKENKVFASKKDNDYAIRVYVGFRGRTPFTPDVIQYVWDDHFPEGTAAESPFLRGTKVFVIRSGKPASPEEWVFERRDLIRDYEMLFGKKPRGNIGAVGIMSDSDNTRTISEAYIRDLMIERPAGIPVEEESSAGFKVPIIGDLGDLFSRFVKTAAEQTNNLKKQSQKFISSLEPKSGR